MEFTDPSVEAAGKMQAALSQGQPVPEPAPVEKPTPPAPQTTGELPMIYHAAAQARVNGYSWDEINDRFSQVRDAAKGAGYDDAAVDKAFGLSPGADAAPPPGLEQVHAQPDTADNIRAFSQKWLTPDNGSAPVSIHGAGDFFKQLGWDAVDVGKIFGGAVVNGVAAIAEGLDGKPRSTEDQVRLGVEAQGALGFLAGGVKFGTPLTKAPAAGLAGLREAVPNVPDTLDAATAIAKAHPEGLTPATLTDAAKTLGQNFVENGEHPLAAAQRATQDPTVMAQMHQQMELPLPQPREIPTEVVHPDAPLDAKAHAEESAAAVKEPGLIQPASTRPAVEPIPVADELARQATEGEVTEANAGLNLSVRMPQMAIDPETIGQANPVLAEGLGRSIQEVFNLPSLDRKGAGIIRNALADVQAARIRSTENLRRFGRAVGDMSSAARQAWVDAYEHGNLNQYTGALREMGQRIRDELDRRYDQMNALGIAPNYIENYLPRLYKDPAGASVVFGRRPLEGSKVFTRQRVYQYAVDAQGAGLEFSTDNPVEAVLIRLNDMDRFINAHQIMNELDQRGLGQRIPQGQRVPPGLTRINDKIATGTGGTFYAPDAIAKMLNRHLAPGFSGKPIYDVVRGSVSMFSTMKLMGSVFHPLILSALSSADMFGLGLKQIARGGLGNALDGLGKIARFPTAPLEDLFKGYKVNKFAATGQGTPQIASIFDTMVASGARFGKSELYNASAAGSFWNAFKGSTMEAFGYAHGPQTFPQELASMFRNAPDIRIGSQKIAPGYIRAMAQMVPRIMDTISDPIMGKLVPAMKSGILARNLQEMMAAHPGMGMDDIRRFGGRESDRIDNMAGEMITDNRFWPSAFNNINNLVFMAPNWFIGKLQLFGGAGADALHAGFVEGPGGSKELSGNISLLLGTIATTVLTGATYGYLKGTWKPTWTLNDYANPPTGGTDSKGGPDRVNLPGLYRDAHGWAMDPEHELKNKVAPIWSALQELGTNTQFNGAAIADPASSWAAAGGDYLKFTAKQLGPMMWSQDIKPEQNITALEQIMGIREAPFDIREPELTAKYERRTEKAAVHKKNKMETP